MTETLTALNRAGEEVAQLGMALQEAWDEAAQWRKNAEGLIRRLQRVKPKAKKKSRRR